MNNKISALLLAVTLGLASTGVSHAMSSLISLSSEPVWPTSSTPEGNLIYNITAVGRAGSGLLLVDLTTGDMPPGVTVTFNPSVLRFTGNQLTSQTATMTVSCPWPLPLDCYPYTLTGTAQRETITITNTVCFSPSFVAVRAPTLYLDSMPNNNLRIRGLGATGKTYQIQVTSSLSNPVWTSLGTATADGNGRFTLFTTMDPTASARFFRAVTTQ
jgi:hypothetical protein